MKIKNNNNNREFKIYSFIQTCPKCKNRHKYITPSYTIESVNNTLLVLQQDIVKEYGKGIRRFGNIIREFNKLKYIIFVERNNIEFPLLDKINKNMCLEYIYTEIFGDW